MGPSILLLLTVPDVSFSSVGLLDRKATDKRQINGAALGELGPMTLGVISTLFGIHLSTYHARRVHDLYERQDS